MDGDDFDDELALRLVAAGGWDLRHAKLLRVIRVRDEVLLLLDTNGDGAEYAADLWRRNDSGWEAWHSSSIASGTSTFGGHGGLLWTVGQSPGRHQVRVTTSEGIREVEVDERGFWVVVEDKQFDDAYPMVVGDPGSVGDHRRTHRPRPPASAWGWQRRKGRSSRAARSGSGHLLLYSVFFGALLSGPLWVAGPKPVAAFFFTAPIAVTLVGGAFIAKARWRNKRG